MTDQISELLRMLRQESELCLELIEQEKRKTSMLIKGDLEAIIESNGIEEDLNSKLRGIGQMMSKACCDLSAAYGMAPEEVTLMKLAVVVDPSSASKIRVHSTEFKNLLKQLKEINRRNKQLIERSANCIQGLLTLISNASGSYQPTGTFNAVCAAHPTFSRQG
jgi:hypothetical protein